MRRASVKAVKSISQAGKKKTATVSISNGGQKITAKASIKTP